MSLRSNALPSWHSSYGTPVPISNALARFLGRPAGTQMSPHEVRDRLCDYARNNGLIEGMTIHADAPLRTLLNLAETDQLRILNLHRYFGDHCPLPRRRAPVAVVPAALHSHELYDEPMGRDLDGPDDGVI
jgi:hypothetical protein